MKVVSQPIPGSRVPLEKLAVGQLLNKFSVFIEPECSLLLSK
jgi:hypothetical protein